MTESGCSSSTGSGLVQKEFCRRNTKLKSGSITDKELKMSLKMKG